MNTSAIIMLIVAMLIIWGGLALAVVNLMVRSSHEPGPDELRRDL
ncbi:methionine/alanine import family NSS transporter small subunit [Nocardioides sp.]|nr:methionine/alanine import family NSS transporter small subunit [Nocardioides sp.]